MSAFVSFPIKTYQDYATKAFEKFAPAAPDFTIENAGALMWFTQLAYEYGPDQVNKIKLMKDLWGFAAITPFESKQNHRYDTHGVVGERDKAVLLAFCGTDPFVFDTVLTDADAEPNEDGIHSGFAEAAAAPEVTKNVADAVALSQKKNCPLLIAGHSLGAAIASLVALEAVKDKDVAAVYTYGMPRTGGEKFKARYDEPLGMKTYRLVNGPDVVPTVPPSSLGYLHVGRLLRCGTNTPFNADDLEGNTRSDDPPFEISVLDLVKHLLSTIKQASPQGPPGLGWLFKSLPAGIRDHLQDQYLDALGFNVEFH